MIAYMCYWKPFRSKYSLYSSLAAELAFACSVLLMFAFISKRTESTGCIIGWTTIGFVVGSLLAAWYCVGAQQLRIFLKRRARLQDKKIPDPKNSGEKTSSPQSTQGSPKRRLRRTTRQRLETAQGKVKVADPQQMREIATPKFPVPPESFGAKLEVAAQKV